MEYCENCKKEVLPEKQHLMTGGDMTLCSECGLSLSATF